MESNANQIVDALGLEKGDECDVIAKAQPFAPSIHPGTGQMAIGTIRHPVGAFVQACGEFLVFQSRKDHTLAAWPVADFIFLKNSRVSANAESNLLKL